MLQILYPTLTSPPIYIAYIPSHAPLNPYENHPFIQDFLQNAT